MKLTRVSVAALALVLVPPSVFARPGAVRTQANPQVLTIDPRGSVVAFCEGSTNRLASGQRVGNWSLMAVLHPESKHPLAVFEDFSEFKGRILVASPSGAELELAKSLEPTWAEPASLYSGHTLEEVLNSDSDLLGQELLAKGGDPSFDEVAACFPPISKMRVYTFVGTRDCVEKVGIFYGGSTPNFDPAAYLPSIEKIRKDNRVLDGLIGGWLPVVRFVYPEQAGTWTELLIYAPMRLENRNYRVQPVWYRLSRIEHQVLCCVRYFDSYHPFPPRGPAKAEAFYEQLLAMRAGWNHTLDSGMRVDVPDPRLASMARHSLVREMITRVGPFPKYGVFDRGYGGSEHDGFPDTFTVDTTAMLEWGLFDAAGRYIDNYFNYFVRDDGSILYRGPETGQFGRMLTLLAEYASYTGDGKRLLRHRRRIDAVTALLLSLRAKALGLPRQDPAYGLIAGWSEADACLDPDPPRYMQPYFSNSSEAVRGFEDLGAAWEKIGRKNHRPDLMNWGERLRRESRELAADVQIAIARSMLTNTVPVCLPAIPGVKEPFDVAVQRDKLDPQFRSYRAYMEMLYSGNLTRAQTDSIITYRAAHRDTILGIPTAYGWNTHELAGFLSYGHAFGLLQHDHIREYLLTLYSLMAHQYTRGTWTAPETRNLDPKQFAAPYCSPAQMVVPLLLRWMLVFEDPASQVLWLAKGTPRDWLQDGKQVAVTNAPTRWGPLSYSLHSHLQTGTVEATLELPSRPPESRVNFRLRVPYGRRIRSVLLDGQLWEQFDAEQEIVTLPARISKAFLVVHY